MSEGQTERASGGTRVLDAALRALAWLPLPALHAAGGLVGSALARMPVRPRRIAEINLALCFPEQTAEQRRALLRRSLRESARTALELAPLFKRRPERVLGWVREVRGEHHLQAGIARGRGVVLLAPHLGAWELLNLWVAQRYPLTALYRPPRQRALEPLLIAARTRNGARLLPAGPRGVRGAMQALSRGEAVGILPDQEPEGQEPFAPLFGVPAKTMTLAGRLAHRFDATVILAFARRLPQGRGFVLHFIPAGPAPADPDPERAAAALNRGIEACIAHAPAQYQWTYKRFNTQPDGRRLYPRRPRR